jgi:hypothetical protein
VVKVRVGGMKAIVKKAMIQETEETVRASISFSSDAYKTLDLIAKDKKVSLAWVVREAVDQYIENRWPLFARKG